MDRQAWLQRWREGRIGWHQDQVTPLLRQHWPSLGVVPGTRVLVPLCGKSLDMPWLAARGLSVLGVEFSPLAVQQFFATQGLAPERREEAGAVHYAAGAFELVQSDVFRLPVQLLAGCGAVYDRAALIALPQDQRQRYAARVYGGLPAGALGLLVVLEYAPGTLDGPPFSVPEPEVRSLFEGNWDVRLLERRRSDGPGRAAGGAVFHAAVYRLQRLGPAPA